MGVHRLGQRLAELQDGLALRPAAGLCEILGAVSRHGVADPLAHGRGIGDRGAGRNLSRHAHGFLAHRSRWPLPVAGRLQRHPESNPRARYRADLHWPARPQHGADGLHDFLLSDRRFGRNRPVHAGTGVSRHPAFPGRVAVYDLYQDRTARKPCRSFSAR